MEPSALPLACALTLAYGTAYVGRPNDRIGMPTLSIHIKHVRDAAPVLVLAREDGSTTTQRLVVGYGPVHDLAHYVVERALALSDAFLGLIASGWDIGDFEVKGTAGRLPADALFAEAAAGRLSAEEMIQQFTSVENFRWSIAMTLTHAGHAQYIPPDIPAATLAAMRTELAELRRRWTALAPGETLELAFVTARRSPCPRPPAAECATEVASSNDRNAHRGRI
jgi:hypothetical protein